MNNNAEIPGTATGLGPRNRRGSSAPEVPGVPFVTPAEAARRSGLYHSNSKSQSGSVPFRSLVLNTLSEVALLGLVALVLHEFFHYVTLQALGGSGYITFDWDLGRTHFTSLPDHLWAVRLSGGLFTGGFLLLFFWYREYASHSARNLSREMAAFSWALGHLAYAPVEMLGYSSTAAALAFGIGFGAAGAVYSVKLIDSLPHPALSPNSGRGGIP